MSESAESEQARIEQLLTRNQRVGPDDCAMLRERARGGRWASTIACAPDVPWAQDTVSRHIYDRCDHDIATPPAPPASPNADQYGDVIGRGECAEIRERVGNGERQCVVAQALERSQSTVCRHARGSCAHAVEEDVRKVER
jgi:hypothetical protein